MRQTILGAYWCLTTYSKFVKNNFQISAVRDHMLFCKTFVCPEVFSILAKSSWNFKFEIHESILIKLLKPRLNKKSPQYRYICFDIYYVGIDYSEKE